MVLCPTRKHKPKYEVVKGAMSQLVYIVNFTIIPSADNVLVFDDCDSILLDDLSLNILKAALDSRKLEEYVGTQTPIC